MGNQNFLKFSNDFDLNVNGSHISMNDFLKSCRNKFFDLKIIKFPNLNRFNELIFLIH